MSSKTNAVRLLDTAKITYELRAYEVDEQDVSAAHVAETLGLSPETLSPIGMRKQFPTFIEEAAQLETAISVSAGKRGLQIILAPTDLATITAAHWSDLIDM